MPVHIDVSNKPAHSRRRERSCGGMSRGRCVFPVRQSVRSESASSARGPDRSAAQADRPVVEQIRRVRGSGACRQLGGPFWFSEQPKSLNRL